VNGFLIDAVAHDARSVWIGVMRHLQMYNLAEIIFRTYNSAGSMQACR
jgi:hypothetical protein